MTDEGIPWLTNHQRDFLAHLTTVTILRQILDKGLKGPRTYDRVSDALGEIAEGGDVTLRGDDENVWVLICGESIVHCERDWLEWAAQNWTTATSN
jgi:hypothetical protein